MGKHRSHPHHIDLQLSDHDLQVLDALRTAMGAPYRSQVLREALHYRAKVIADEMLRERRNEGHVAEVAKGG